MCRFLCGQKSSVCLVKQLGMQLLDDERIFSVLRTRQIIFRSSCTTLHSYPQRMRVPTAPWSCQHLVLSVFKFCHPNKYAVLFHCWFNLHFPVTFPWVSFHMLIFHMQIFGELSAQVFNPFFKITAMSAIYKQLVNCIQPEQCYYSNVSFLNVIKISWKKCH